jgi:hypothetical protein
MSDYEIDSLIFFGYLPKISLTNKHATLSLSLSSALYSGNEKKKNWGLVESAVFNWFLFFFFWRYEMLGQAQRDLTAEQAAQKLFSQPDVHYKAEQDAN